MICVMTVSIVADIAKLSKEEQADTVKKQLPIPLLTTINFIMDDYSHSIQLQFHAHSYYVLLQ